MMDKLSAIVFLMGFYFVNAKVKIHELRVPKSIEVGNNVTLDCLFSADESVEIIWYLGGDILTRWVPGEPPRVVSDRFSKNIDSDFKVTDDARTMYRALRLLNTPNTMSGNYTCKVKGMSYVEDSQRKFMRVFSKIDITDLRVPESVELTTDNTDVVLDCEYVQGDEGLEIKWFLNDEVNQIYQWLPGRKPQALGTIKDNIDTTYKISNDGNTMYRALHIVNMSTDMTGNYTCKVSGFNSEDLKTKPMVVYKPAIADIELIHNDAEKLILCSAYGLYPSPDMDLYVRDEDKKTIIEDTDDKDDILLHGGDTYNVTKTIDYSDKQLPAASEIVCHLHIPGTTYSATKTQQYLHGNSWHSESSRLLLLLCFLLAVMKARCIS